MANENYPATTIAQATELFYYDVNSIHDIINGDSDEVIAVDDGDIPTIRKALTDNFYYYNPIEWEEGEYVTEFNQLVQFTDDSIWYAPSARSVSSVLMGTTPYGDSSWIPSPFSPAGLSDFVTISTETPTSEDGEDGDVWFVVPA